MEGEEGMIIVRAISRIVFYCRRYRHSQAYLRLAACAVLATLFSSPQLAAATTVRMETTLGGIDIELYDNQAPITVANFLAYAGRGDYTNNGFIHRSVPGFILQGGGYIYGNSPLGIFVTRIPVLDPPIQNEFSASRSNIRGTIAMAKLPDDPNSATSEWFFNLADNSANLDYQNGGFTVFGHVLTGMNVVDAIASLDTWNATSVNGALGELPLIEFVSTTGLQPNNLVQVTGIFKVAFTNTLSGALVRFTADLDMIFSGVATASTTDTASLLATFSPPAHKTVQFNDGIFAFTLTGTMPSSRVVTLFSDDPIIPTHYYAYGKTPDNTAPHWYDFSYDGETGAEIVRNKVIMHFVDGKRGDDDLDSTNGSVTHTGAPAVVTANTSAQSNQSGGGCSIVTAPSQTTSNGDWVVISMFLAFVALVRRRARNGRIQRAPR